MESGGRCRQAARRHLDLLGSKVSGPEAETGFSKVKEEPERASERTVRSGGQPDVSGSKAPSACYPNSSRRELTVCVPGGQGRESRLPPPPAPGAGPGGTGWPLGVPGSPPRCGAAGSPGQEGLGTPSCLVQGVGFGGSGVPVANGEGSSLALGSPETRLGPGPPPGDRDHGRVGKSVTPKAERRSACVHMSVHMCLFGQGWSVALVRSRSE